MLIVTPASTLVVVLMAESRLCVLTSKRTGPFGEAPVLGRLGEATCAAALPITPLGSTCTVTVARRRFRSARKIEEAYAVVVAIGDREDLAVCRERDEPHSGQTLTRYDQWRARARCRPATQRRVVADANGRQTWDGIIAAVHRVWCGTPAR
jgi:hypothetical protein